MGIVPSWDNKQRTVIRLDFEAGWGWTDLLDILPNLQTMLREPVSPIDIIANFQKTSLPQDDFPTDMFGDDVSPYTEGLILLVDYTDDMARSISNWMATRRDLSQNIAFMEDISDARLILAESEEERPAEKEKLFDIEWYTPNRDILVTFHRDIVILELLPLNHMLKVMLDQASRARLILDMTNVSRPLGRPMVFMHTMDFLRHPNLQSIGLVNIGSGIFQTFADVTDILEIELNTFDNMEKVEAYLQR